VEYFFEKDASHSEWSLEYSNLLKKRFLKNKSIQRKRKLFISRALDDKRLRTLSEIVHKVFNGYPLSKEEIKIFNNIHPRKYAEHADRTMSLDDEKKLEKSFEDAGYEIIDPGQALNTTYEQAELYNSATHIVTLPGAGLANLCFADEDVKVLILNNTDSYFFPHLEIAQSLGIYCVESPKRITHSNRIYRTEEILKSVKRDYPEFLI
jgi:capsular polysaccharide biosynthesis protein